MEETFQVQVTELARAARAGLEATPAKDLGLGFGSFPHGTCGPVAELMGRIVLEQTGQTGIYVCGGGHPALGPQQSHAWLEVGGLIVDLTHDQFEHTGLVGWVFETSSWHARFERDINELCLSPAQWGQYPHAAYGAMTGALARLTP